MQIQTCSALTLRVINSGMYIRIILGYLYVAFTSSGKDSVELVCRILQHQKCINQANLNYVCVCMPVCVCLCVYLCVSVCVFVREKERHIKLISKHLLFCGCFFFYFFSFPFHGLARREFSLFLLDLVKGEMNCLCRFKCDKKGQKNVADHSDQNSHHLGKQTARQFLLCTFHCFVVRFRSHLKQLYVH